MQFILHCAETNQLFAGNKVLYTSYKFVYRLPGPLTCWKNGIFNALLMVYVLYSLKLNKGNIGFGTAHSLDQITYHCQKLINNQIQFHRLFLTYGYYILQWQSIGNWLHINNNENLSKKIKV